ncbi:hypothetical protein PORCRE_1361 [Porphyromonas crevioricanis JCM 15906]|uniref:Uncharacterized protein n=2 Tax=Porphyromonas crevioricanis TaxID=393921 RepID=A0A2X4PJC3_9PORP|nr:hypothetical protein PORCRE_1361 [Porphyromonas crevioricanis JCM 15906]SQH72780.1 Uncharacterised protein [Porphyromonas crevioricanis]
MGESVRSTYDLTQYPESNTANLFDMNTAITNSLHGEQG